MATISLVTVSQSQSRWLQTVTVSLVTDKTSLVTDGHNPHWLQTETTSLVTDGHSLISSIETDTTSSATDGHNLISYRRTQPHWLQTVTISLVTDAMETNSHSSRCLNLLG